jgi:hypothetical protein
MSADFVRGAVPGTSQMLAVPMFVVVGAIGYGANQLPGGSRGRASFLLAAQAIFLLTAACLAVHSNASVHPKGHVDLGVGMLAVAAMALQNTIFT